MNWKHWSAVAVFALAALLIGSTLEINSPTGFVETGVVNEDTDWRRVRGTVNCLIYGTFDSATASVETRVTVSPEVIRNVGVSGLVGVVAPMDTADRHIVDGWVQLQDAGESWIRLHVTGGGGSVDIDWTCRW